LRISVPKSPFLRNPADAPLFRIIRYICAMALAFVSEDHIDQVLEELGDDPNRQQEALESLRTAQPVILAYLFTENFNAFLKQEKEYLLYLLLVIWESVKKTGATLATIDEDKLSEAEEANWDLLQQVESKRFRDRLDVFFKDTRQEDLLAFIEDSLLDEEDGFVSKEGREPMFVILKSILDSLHQSA